MWLGNKIFTAIVTEVESRRHGMCSVCMTAKYSKDSAKSASVQNVCAKAALTDSSSNKKQLQGTIVMKGNFIRTYFCVVAWEMEGINMITLVNKILAHERFSVFLTKLFTLNPNMQSKFFHHPQFLYNGLFNY